MAAAWPKYIAAIILLAAAHCVAAAQGAIDIEAFNKQIDQLYGDGKYVQATTLAQQSLALAERVLGAEHPETLRSVNNLAFLDKAQGRYAEAEPLFKRAVETYKRVFGEESPDTLSSVNNLAAVCPSRRWGPLNHIF